MFRMVVQDSRRTPTSGKVVARIGSYDPHNKAVTLDKEKAAFYLEHGAQPSTRAVSLLSSEGVTIPNWVKVAAQKKRTVRNADKRRSTRPPEPEAEAEETKPEEAAPAETEGANEAAPADEDKQTEESSETATEDQTTENA